MWFSLPASDRNLLDSATRVQAEMTVQAAPATVFELITQPDRLVRWSADTKRAWWLEGRGGLGHRRQRVLQGMNVQERFILWATGSRCAYAIESATLPLVQGMVEDIRLVPVAPDVTLVSWSVHFRLATAVKFVDPLVRQSVQRALQRGLKQLQRYCSEQRPADGPATSAPDPAPSTPDFPCGWYAVAVAREVAPGGHTIVMAFGEELDVRRSMDGQAQVSGVGHGDRWVTDEVNGLLCVWYDSEGGPPRWRLEPQPELEDHRWGPMQWAALEPLDTSLWTLREDAVEPEHYPAVHGMRVPTIRAESTGHELRVVNRMTLAALPGPWSDTTLHVDLHGRLCGVGLYFYRSHFGIGDGQYLRQFGISAATPIDGRRVMIIYGLCVRKLPVPGLTELITSTLMTETLKGYEADRPRMAGGSHDGSSPDPASTSALGQFARWYHQFVPTGARGSAVGVRAASGRATSNVLRVENVDS